MAHYTHGWIGTLAGMLDMEEEHCRENLQHYESGPDHDTYAAFLADVVELRKRLRLYDAADSMLGSLRMGLEWSEGDGESDESPLVTEIERAFRATARTSIAKAEGRRE